MLKKKLELSFKRFWKMCVGEATVQNLRLAGETRRPRRPVICYIWPLINGMFHWYYILIVEMFVTFKFWSPINGPWSVIVSKPEKNSTFGCHKRDTVRKASLNRVLTKFWNINDPESLMWPSCRFKKLQKRKKFWNWLSQTRHGQKGFFNWPNFDI